jgi:hypothetical protein
MDLYRVVAVDPEQTTRVVSEREAERREEIGEMEIEIEMWCEL